jgi:hypothetical protein
MFGRFDPGRRQLRVRNLARTEILEELSPQSRELLPFDLHHRFAPVCDTTLCPRHLLPTREGRSALRSLPHQIRCSAGGRLCFSGLCLSSHGCEATEEELRRSGFLFGSRFDNRPFQVGDAVWRDDDKLPALDSGFVKEIKISRRAGRHIEVDFAVFPFGHFASSKLKAPANAGWSKIVLGILAWRR